MAKKTGEIIAEMPTIDLADEVVHLCLDDWNLFVPLPIAKKLASQLARRISEYEAKRAVVVPLAKGRRRAH